jgi:uncharacterized protein (DUF1015 family)
MTISGARVEPFPALVFNRERAGRLDDLIAPPYDLIDETKQQELYDRSPYNVVRLELNRDPDPYASAAATIARWIEDGILQRLPPAMYLYTQRFEVDGRRCVRTGWVVRIRLEEFEHGRILPHERTFPKAKEDRLRLLAATRANISPVFGLYRSDDKELRALSAAVASRTPMLEAADDLGILHQVRRVESPAEIMTVQQALESSRVLIADGHHRYETALEYHRLISANSRVPGSVQQGEPSRSRFNKPALGNAQVESAASVPRPDAYVMMTLVALDDPGLVILPTHRLVRALGQKRLELYKAKVREKFEVEEFADAETMMAELKRRGRGHIGAVIRDTPAAILRLRNEDLLSRASPEIHAEVGRLDVTVLHQLILDQLLGITPATVRGGENISYTHDWRTALEAVRSNVAAGVFLLNAPEVSDIEKITNAGALMPEKSTYFYPKLQTGLLINPLY